MRTPVASARTANILLVEDTPSEIELTRLAFQRAGTDVALHVVRDGIECLEFLRRQGAHANAPVPDLILLDLNLPLLGGASVLAEIKADPQLKSLPVVVLTTSTLQDDIQHLYRLGASSYLVKPVDFGEFCAMIVKLNAYWLKLVLLPDR